MKSKHELEKYPFIQLLKERLLLSSNSQLTESDFEALQFIPNCSKQKISQIIEKMKINDNFESFFMSDSTFIPFDPKTIDILNDKDHFSSAEILLLCYEGIAWSCLQPPYDESFLSKFLNFFNQLDFTLYSQICYYTLERILNICQVGIDHFGLNEGIKISLLTFYKNHPKIPSTFFPSLFGLARSIISSRKAELCESLFLSFKNILLQNSNKLNETQIKDLEKYLYSYAIQIEPDLCYISLEILIIIQKQYNLSLLKNVSQCLPKVLVNIFQRNKIFPFPEIKEEKYQLYDESLMMNNQHQSNMFLRIIPCFNCSFNTLKTNMNIKKRYKFIGIPSVDFTNILSDDEFNIIKNYSERIAQFPQEELELFFSTFASLSQDNTFLPAFLFMLFIKNMKKTESFFDSFHQSIIHFLNINFFSPYIHVFNEEPLDPNVNIIRDLFIKNAINKNPSWIQILFESARSAPFLFTEYLLRILQEQNDLTYYATEPIFPLIIRSAIQLQEISPDSDLNIETHPEEIEIKEKRIKCITKARYINFLFISHLVKHSPKLLQSPIFIETFLSFLFENQLVNGVYSTLSYIFSHVSSYKIHFDILNQNLALIVNKCSEIIDYFNSHPEGNGTPINTEVKESTQTENKRTRKLSSTELDTLSEANGQSLEVFFSISPTKEKIEQMKSIVDGLANVLSETISYDSQIVVEFKGLIGSLLDYLRKHPTKFLMDKILKVLVSISNLHQLKQFPIDFFNILIQTIKLIEGNEPSDDTYDYLNHALYGNFIYNINSSFIQEPSVLPLFIGVFGCSSRFSKLIEHFQELTKFSKCNIISLHEGLLDYILLKAVSQYNVQINDCNQKSDIKNDDSSNKTVAILVNGYEIKIILNDILIQNSIFPFLETISRVISDPYFISTCIKLIDNDYGIVTHCASSLIKNLLPGMRLKSYNIIQFNTPIPVMQINNINWGDLKSGFHFEFSVSLEDNASKFYSYDTNLMTISSANGDYLRFAFRSGTFLIYYSFRTEAVRTGLMAIGKNLLIPQLRNFQVSFRPISKPPEQSISHKYKIFLFEDYDLNYTYDFGFLDFSEDIDIKIGGMTNISSSIIPDFGYLKKFDLFGCELPGTNVEISKRDSYLLFSLEKCNEVSTSFPKIPVSPKAQNQFVIAQKLCSFPYQYNPLAHFKTGNFLFLPSNVEDVNHPESILGSYSKESFITKLEILYLSFLHFEQFQSKFKGTHFISCILFFHPELLSIQIYRILLDIYFAISCPDLQNEFFLSIVSNTWIWAKSDYETFNYVILSWIKTFKNEFLEKQLFSRFLDQFLLFFCDSKTTILEDPKNGSKDEFINQNFEKLQLLNLKHNFISLIQSMLGNSLTKEATENILNYIYSSKEDSTLVSLLQILFSARTSPLKGRDDLTPYFHSLINRVDPELVFLSVLAIHEISEGNPHSMFAASLQLNSHPNSDVIFQSLLGKMDEYPSIFYLVNAMAIELQPKYRSMFVESLSSFDIHKLRKASLWYVLLSVLIYLVSIEEVKLISAFMARYFQQIGSLSLFNKIISFLERLSGLLFPPELTNAQNNGSSSNANIITASFVHELLLIIDKSDKELTQRILKQCIWSTVFHLDPVSYSSDFMKYYHDSEFFSEYEYKAVSDSDLLERNIIFPRNVTLLSEFSIQNFCTPKIYQRLDIQNIWLNIMRYFQANIEYDKIGLTKEEKMFFDLLHKKIADHLDDKEKQKLGTLTSSIMQNELEQYLQILKPSLESISRRITRLFYKTKEIIVTSVKIDVIKTKNFSRSRLYEEMTHYSKFLEYLNKPLQKIRNSKLLIHDRLLCSCFLPMKLKRKSSSLCKLSDIELEYTLGYLSFKSKAKKLNSDPNPETSQESKELKFIKCEYQKRDQRIQCTIYKRPHYFELKEELPNGTTKTKYLNSITMTIPIELPNENGLYLVNNDFTPFLFKFPKDLDISSVFHIKINKKKIIEDFELKWNNREITNLSFLMRINLIAGRNFDDPSNYPILPSVLRDYFNRASFSDLEKLPIGYMPLLKDYRTVAYNTPVLPDIFFDPSLEGDLPKWASNSYEFNYLIRKILNSESISSNLHKFINTYFYNSGKQKSNSKTKDENMKNDGSYITPMNLLSKPLARKSLPEIKSFIARYPSLEDVTVLASIKSMNILRFYLLTSDGDIFISDEGSNDCVKIDHIDIPDNSIISQCASMIFVAIPGEKTYLIDIQSYERKDKKGKLIKTLEGFTGYGDVLPKEFLKKIVFCLDNSTIVMRNENELKLIQRADDPIKFLNVSTSLSLLIYATFDSKVCFVSMKNGKMVNEVKFNERICQIIIGDQTSLVAVITEKGVSILSLNGEMIKTVECEGFLDGKFWLCEDEQGLDIIGFQTRTGSIGIFEIFYPEKKKIIWRSDSCLVYMTYIKILRQYIVVTEHGSIESKRKTIDMSVE